MHEATTPSTSRQTSRVRRLDQILEPIRRKIVSDAFAPMRVKYVASNAFPDDTDEMRLCIESFQEAWEALNKVGYDLMGVS